MATKYQDIIFGFDFIQTESAPFSSKIATVSTINAGMESAVNVADLEASSVKANEYFLNGIDADRARALLRGESYLEFWIKAIDHTKPTVNNRLYTAEAMEAALSKYNVENQFRCGGIPSANEHPVLKMDSDNPDSNMNMWNTMQAVVNVDPMKRTHWITAYKVTPEATYLKVRTDPKNPVIVSDILAKKIPAFSIRTKGDFTMKDGAQVATRLDFICADYVSNPASASAVAMPQMKYVDPLNMKEFNMELVQRSGNAMAAESVNNVFGDYIQEGDKLLYNEGLETAQMISNMIIRRPIKEKQKESFEKHFARAKAFLD